MRKIIWILTTLMMLGWSASIQASNAPEDAWRYQVRLDGTTALRLEMPCYDRTNLDSWVSEGYVYITPDGGTKETLFYYESQTDIADGANVSIHCRTDVDGTMTLERNGMSSVQVSSQSQWVEIPDVSGQEYAMVYLRWIIPSAYRGKNVTISWDIDKDGNGVLEAHKKIDITPVTMFIPAEPEPIKPQLMEPMLSYSETHRNEIMVPYIMASNHIKSLTATYNTAPAYVTDKSAYGKTQKLDTLSSGYLYLPADATISDLKLTATYINTDKNLVMTQSDAITLPMMHQPKMMTATMLNDGSAVVQWRIIDNGWSDIQTTDSWEVHRNVDGDPVNGSWTMVGQLEFSPFVRELSYTDNTLLQAYKDKPVYYRVRRMMTSMWGWHTRSDYAQCQLLNGIVLPSFVKPTAQRNGTWSEESHPVNINFTLGGSSSQYDSQGRFIIRSAADWDTFCDLLESSNSSLSAVMANDIELNENNKIAGYGYHMYTGTFDGNGHTLTFNYKSGQRDDAICLFNTLDRATIRNLHVAGTIEIDSDSQYYNSVLISRCTRTTLENCRVSATIKLVNKNGKVAGFIGESGRSGNNKLINCVFDGSFICPEANDNCAGFVYYNSDHKDEIVMTNCVFNPTELHNCSGQNFVRDGSATLLGSYATTDLNAIGTTPQKSDPHYDSQGRFVIKSAADWETFRNLVATAQGQNVNAILAADIIVTTMIGTNDENRYYGTFDGGGHTITFNYVYYDFYSALFSHVGTCTIKNLHVTGRVTGKAYSGAIIGRCENNSSKTVTIENCRVSTFFDINIHSGGYRGAFIGQANDAKVILRNNLYDGKIQAYQQADKSNLYIGVFIGHGYKAGIDICENNLDDGTCEFEPLATAEVALSYDSQGSAASPVGMMKKDGKSNAELLALLGDQWTEEDGKVVPKMETYTTPSKFPDDNMSKMEKLEHIALLVGEEKMNLMGNTIVPKMELSDDPELKTAIWDERAKAYLYTDKLVGDSVIATVRQELIKEQMTDGKVALDITTPCVDHQFRLAIERSTSPLPLPKDNVVNVQKIDEGSLAIYEFNNNVVITSLKADTLQSSVTLTWETNGGDADGYIILRRDKMAEEGTMADTLQSNYQHQQYIDNTVAPQHSYIYTVEGITQCQGEHKSSKQVEGACKSTGMVRGYVRMANGVGMPGVKVWARKAASSPKIIGYQARSCVTDSTGYYEIGDLVYQQSAIYEITIEIPGDAASFPEQQVEFNDVSNLASNVVFTQTQYAIFSGTVMFEGSSIPVSGVRFLRDSVQVTDGAGNAVTTDAQGHFSLSIPYGDHTIQVVKEGHVFKNDGYLIDPDSNNPDKRVRNWASNMASYYFWDQTRVNLQGRVVGGNVQGLLPLGKSLSKNNLGDSLTVVFQLEGDNASWIVRDQSDLTIRERDSLHLHGFNRTDTTIVHASRYRIKIHPDSKTGEYELPIYPVKYKIIEVYANGYPSLFQPGSVSETIDLTAFHNGDTARWSRIYHAGPSLVRQQFNGNGENYFGIKRYVANDVAGLSDTVQVWYPELDKDGKVVKDGKGTYTLGYPVYRSGQPVSMVLTAREEYYYNNDKTKPLDTVPLDSAELIITNGMHSQEDTDPVTLDKDGMYSYIFTPVAATFTQEGQNALRTITFTLKYEGAYYEMEPIHGYLLASIAQPQGRRVIAGTQPHLVEILRDPPGALSTAFIEKGSKLHYSYTKEYTKNVGAVLNAGGGSGLTWYKGFLVGNTTEQGTIFESEQNIGVQANLYTTHYDKTVYDYTLDIKERIETSDESRFAQYVGNGSDLYIGLSTAIIAEDALAVRLVPSAALKRLMPAAGGQVTIEGRNYNVNGTVKVIASGYDAQKKDSVYLIRDEVMQVTDKVQSTFVHSQAYLLEEMIPNLIRTRNALLLGVGTDPAYAQKLANSKQCPTYISKVASDDAHFAQLGYYDMFTPTNTPNVSHTDSIVGLNSQIKTWTGFIRRNEQEKLEAGRLLKNYDFDGHSNGISYSEDFNATYENGGYWAIPSVDLTGGWSGNTSEGNYGRNMELEYNGDGFYFGISITPMIGFKFDYMSEGGKEESKSTGFTLRCSTRSNLNVDVYRIVQDTTLLAQQIRNGEWGAFYKLSGETLKSIIDGNYSRLQNWTADLNYGSFAFRTRGGATSQPYEDERLTKYYMPGTVLDQKTMPLDNLKIWTDQHVVSNVPYDEPARYTIKISNESEFPERVTKELLLYLEESMNKDGAKIFIDGHALTGSGIDVWLEPNTVVEKQVEVYAGAGFDYEDIGISIVDDVEPERYNTLTIDAHFIPTAGKVNISSPGDKWVVNTESPEDSTGHYLPVTIDGFDVTQENFDHIELQYKLSTQGDKEWVNTCSYYKDKELMAQASGVRKLITDDGHINAVFYGESDPIEQRYDLRAVIYRRHGNGYLTSSSKILSGIKDTRLPTLFGKPQPANGILDIGDDIKMVFSEEIASNYLKKENNFEVLGLTNKSSISLSTCLHLNIKDSYQDGRVYATTDVNRNLAGKSFTFDVMLLPEEHDSTVVVLSHGSEKNLQIGLTKDNRMMARFNNQIVEGNKAITFSALRQLNYVFEADDEQKTTEVRFYDGNAPVGSGTVEGIYEGNGPISLGSDIQGVIYDTEDPTLNVYRGDMLELRLWNRALSTGEMADYAQKRLTGYELGLVDNWPMNEGKGIYLYDRAVGGADIRLVNNTTWKTPDGMSLKLDGEKGVLLNAQYFNRADYHDYTLMFWFNTSQKNGTLLANGEAKDEPGSKNHFNIGVKDGEFFFRGAGYEAKAAGDVADGQWHHAALTVSRSRNVCNLYVDTKLKESFAADVLGGIVGNTLAAGATYAKINTPTDALKGNLDELAMYEMALTENLIKNYSATTPAGKELGTMVYLPFSRVERQDDNLQRMMPSGLSIARKRSSQGEYSTTLDTIIRPEVIDLVADRVIYAPMNNSGALENLNYSYVADKQNLLININEPESDIEKTHVYITLRDVADLQGNLLASPVVMDLYVHQSPLRWTEKRKTLKTQYGEEYVFDVTIQNVSGKAHSFELKELPLWITASETSGTIDELDEKTITLTMSPYINIGDYEERITIIGEDGITEPLPLSIRVRGEVPDWAASESLKAKNISMNIVARVVVNDDIASDPNGIVHVYGDGHETLGVTHVNVDNTAGSNEALTYIIVYSPDGQGKALHFEYYDAKTGRIYQLEPAGGEKILFKADAIVGSTTNPVELVNNNKEVQTLQLKKGWNWLSFYVRPDKNTIGNLLDGSTKWSVGDALEVVNGNGKVSHLFTYTSKRQKANPTLYDYFWDNGSDSIQLDPTIRYRFYSDNEKVAYVTGTYNADEAINVLPGWNRIGYVSRLNLPVATALADYTDKGSVGDIIKSQNEFSVLTEAGGVRSWKGTLAFMKSGQGYMLKRNADTSTSFYYPEYMDNSRYDGVNARPYVMEDPLYDNTSGVSMNIIAQTLGVELEEGDRLAVYSDGILCGVTEQTADGLFFLSVGQTEVGDGQLSFAIERGDDIIATTPVLMTYHSDSVSGTLSEPTLINFTTIDRVADGAWYDMQGRKLQKQPTTKGVYIYNGQKTIVE